MSKLFLLSTEEAAKIPVSLLRCNKGPYWLRSSNMSYSNLIYTVDHDVMIPYDAYLPLYVRPALFLMKPLDELHLEQTRKGHVKFGYNVHKEKPYKWLDISEYIGKPCLFAKKPIAVWSFDRVRDVNMTYSTSEIKSDLDWIAKKIFDVHALDLIADWRSDCG